MSERFEIGDLIHNKFKHTDGRVTQVTDDGYKVAVPLGCYSWILGKKNDFWRDSEVEASQNIFLREHLPLHDVA